MNDQKLRELASGAKPGPWSLRHLQGGHGDWAVAAEPTSGCIALMVDGWHDYDPPADAAHIAAWSPERAHAALDCIVVLRYITLTNEHPSVHRVLAAWDALYNEASL